MKFQAEEHRAELQLYRLTKAYYYSIRRPWLEWTTFVFALLGAVAVSLRRFGIGITDYENKGLLLTFYYWAALLIFATADALLAKSRNPTPKPFGPLNPGDICEKFAAQGRIWQLLPVVMLPITARLAAIIMFVFR